MRPRLFALFSPLHERQIPIASLPSGAPFTVIGVLPAAFHFARLGDPEVFATLLLKNGAGQTPANDTLSKTSVGVRSGE